MGDVNAILNGEIFILRGKMNSIERARARASNALLNARVDYTRATVCQVRLLPAVQLQPDIMHALCSSFLVRKDLNPCASYN